MRHIYTTLLVLILLAVPASAYVVVLNDGTQISARDKPRVDGDKAYLMLPSGTETFIAASEIDFDKTAEVNQVNLGTTTRVIEEKVLTTTAPPPPAKPTLTDLARQRSLSAPEASRRQTSTVEPIDVPTTAAGFSDLMAMSRVDYPGLEIKADLLRYLRGQGFDQIGIYQGSSADRVFLDIVANTEASVFKALKDSATALLQVSERFPNRVAAFELLMATESQVRAGQFLLTPDLAHLLASGSISPESFFLRYVQF